MADMDMTVRECEVLQDVQSGIEENLKTAEEWKYFGREVSDKNDGMPALVVDYVTQEQGKDICKAISDAVRKGDDYSIPGTAVTFCSRGNGRISVSANGEIREENLRAGLILERYVNKNIVGVVSTGMKEDMLYTPLNTIIPSYLTVKDRFSTEETVKWADGTPIVQEAAGTVIWNSRERTARFMPEERMSADDAKKLFDVLVNISRSKGIPVTETDDGEESADERDRDENIIILDKSNYDDDAALRCEALLRETIRMSLENDIDMFSEPDVSDVALYSIEYMVAKEFGIGVTEKAKSLAMLAEMEKDCGSAMLAVQENIRTITAEADQLINEINAELERMKTDICRDEKPLQDGVAAREAAREKMHSDYLKKERDYCFGSNQSADPYDKRMAAQVDDSIRNANLEIEKLRDAKTIGDFTAAETRIETQFARAESCINDWREEKIKMIQRNAPRNISDSTSRFYANPKAYLDELSLTNETVAGMYHMEREYTAQSAYAWENAVFMNEDGTDVFAEKVAEQAKQIGKIADSENGCFVEIIGTDTAGHPELSLPCGTLMHPAAFQHWTEKAKETVAEDKKEKGSPVAMFVKARVFTKDSDHLRASGLDVRISDTEPDGNISYRNGFKTVCADGKKETGIDMEKAQMEFAESSKKENLIFRMYCPKDLGAEQCYTAPDGHSEKETDVYSGKRVSMRDGEMQRAFKENSAKKHSVSAAKGDKHR